MCAETCRHACRQTIEQSNTTLFNTHTNYAIDSIHSLDVHAVRLRLPGTLVVALSASSAAS